MSIFNPQFFADEKTDQVLKFSGGSYFAGFQIGTEGNFGENNVVILSREQVRELRGALNAFLQESPR